MQSRLLTNLKKRALENTVGKRENAGNPVFPPFPTVFSTPPNRKIIILATFNLSSANAFYLVLSKTLLFEKGLNHSCGEWLCVQSVSV